MVSSEGPAHVPRFWRFAEYAESVGSCIQTWIDEQQLGTSKERVDKHYTGAEEQRKNNGENKPVICDDSDDDGGDGDDIDAGDDGHKRAFVGK
ncbi:hypothetical protein T265_04377 [Opisthorchis viverrini]|uniref:Uncharacterized protein n=1 Tax=Opisthorchis viverrini TaxID=6198 RepID=A0A074ZP70_OPIVI|nr:hypothetical protein T265_04377 [Opisthorchis viverrini]KER28921.1 hypothetical protein T265_04377 [Opisthorchis viverrini]